MSKRKYKYDLYEVCWLDAEGDPGWTDPKAPIQPVPVINIGFFVMEDDDYIKLAAAYIDNGKAMEHEVSSTDIIPKRMITSMKQITVRYVNNGKAKTRKQSGSTTGRDTTNDSVVES